jgi:lactoylglutathione lyase
MNEKARLVGINHVALEVGNIEEALAFYGRVFEFSLRGRSEKMAFINMGDQFIALFEAHTQHPDEGRHFGLVVDDEEKVRRQLEQAGVQLLPGRGVEFRDPSATACKS